MFNSTDHNGAHLFHDGALLRGNFDTKTDANATAARFRNGVEQKRHHNGGFLVRDYQAAIQHFDPETMVVLDWEKEAGWSVWETPGDIRKNHMPNWEQMQQMPGFGACKACGQKRRGRCLDGNKPVRDRYKDGVAYDLGGCSAGWIPRFKNQRRGVATTPVGGGWSMSRPHPR